MLWLVWLLTALGALVVVLTRLRLRDRETRGHHAVSRGLLNVHTGAGVAALLAWSYFLIGGDGAPAYDLAGVIGLGLWWLTSLAGLGLLARWLPSRGRHAATDAGDRRWTGGAGPSLLAHLGTFAATLVFTYAYVTGAV